jgi:hypothetical protein
MAERELEEVEELELHARLNELAAEREHTVRGFSRRYLLLTTDLFLLGAVAE